MQPQLGGHVVESDRSESVIASARLLPLLRLHMDTARTRLFPCHDPGPGTQYSQYQLYSFRRHGIVSDDHWFNTDALPRCIMSGWGGW